MKYKLILLLISISIAYAGYTQTEEPVSIDSYRKIPGVKFIDTISESFITGELMINCTFTGLIVRLDPNMSYKKYDFTCVSKTKIGQGTWSIFNNRMLELKNENSRKLYDIIQYDSYYFFVELAERKKFISALKDKTTGRSLNTEYLAKQPPGSPTR
ncbi:MULTISPECIES: hypothetical protein [Niastella]|uniref:Secreted protein n=1 Tax=Niastella soli TaxID=2821487 RepID=A0ABS3YZI9_9BACT|nr:hypothetical protein [Niastella soli]MBO9203344.1 hypothetical protein [Niastella soli]